MNKPTTSIIIPTFNRQDMIARAIESVIRQTCQNFELIVVDDGSTDNTADMIRQRYPQIRYIYQENSGANAARNRGIEAAEGEWIAFLDSDDEWQPEKLQLQIEHLQRNPDLVWSYTNYIIRFINGAQDRLGHESPDVCERLLNGKEYFEHYFEAFLAYIPTCTITMMVKRKAIMEAGMFLESQPWSHDTDMCLRLAYRWPEVGYLSEPLSINHWGGADTITQQKNKKRTVKECCDFVDRHIKLASQADHLSQFEPCAVKMLKDYMRVINHNDRFVSLREIISRFGYLIPLSLKMEIRSRAAFPNLMLLSRKVYSRLLRIFDLIQHQDKRI